jgi:hypothetical protein
MTMLSGLTSIIVRYSDSEMKRKREESTFQDQQRPFTKVSMTA